MERNADKLIRALAKHPAGESKSTLRDLAGLSGTEVNAALALLLERGEAVSAELLKGNRKTPITGYKLAE